MKCRLVIKVYNSLYTIYLIKLCKVLVGVLCEVIIVFNFHIYKKLFSLIGFTFKIFYPFIFVGIYRQRLYKHISPISYLYSNLSAPFI